MFHTDEVAASLRLLLAAVANAKLMILFSCG